MSRSHPTRERTKKSIHNVLAAHGANGKRIHQESHRNLPVTEFETAIRKSTTFNVLTIAGPEDDLRDNCRKSPLRSTAQPFPNTVVNAQRKFD